jgi:TonB-linked SusC/RagA family outer membrane protein
MKKNYVEHSPWRNPWVKYIMMMKAVWILVMIPVLQVTAGNMKSYSQSTKMNLKLKDVSLEEVIWSIKKVTEFNFFYNSEDIKGIDQLDLDCKDATAEEILIKCLEGTDLTYEIVNKAVIIKKAEKPAIKVNDTPLEQQPQRKEIKGTVKDTQGLPLPGVSVVVKGTTTGTITDVNGEFDLSVPVDAKVLVFSFVGMKTIEVLAGNKTMLNIVLEEEMVGIEDVVVVGYGIQKKETVTGAVSAIKTTDLLQSPQANISNALVGRLPGLFAVQRSGEPGKDQSTIRIRGIGTFAGTQDPLVMVDGIESTNYNNIDPNEIESISILKDASATAVYGVRGANGVLLITTKRGVTGSPKVSLSSSVARSSFPFLRENMNAYEFATSYNKALAYDSYVTGNYTPLFSEEDIELFQNHQDPIFHPDNDWYELMLKDFSIQTKHNLNIRGGTEKVKYFFSLGYLYQNGMYNTESYDGGFDAQLRYNRYNLRSNFDFDVTKRLTASIDISTQIDNNRAPNWETGLFMEMLSSISPVAAPNVIDGKLVTIGKTVSYGGGSPHVAFNKGWNKQYVNNLSGSVRLNYKLDYITEGLSSKFTLSYKNYNTQRQQYTQQGITYEALQVTDDELVFIPSKDTDQFQFSESVNKNRRIYLEFGLEYARNFGGHSVTALVLYNQSKYHSPDLAFLVPNAYQGIVGRVTYNYKSRYLAEFDLGYNGTENFAPGKRFGFFPAYSLGWVASEESFFPKNDYLTFVKIRGSYGEVGNDKIGGDRFLYRPTAYSYSGQYYFGEVGSSYQPYQSSGEGKLGNPDLTWERARKTNIGAELRLMKDKIGLTVDWFVEKRDNILWNKGTIPQIIGADFPAYNLGRMRNSGFDGSIEFRDRINDKFDYFVKANYTYAHNKIEFQDEVDRPFKYQYRTGQRYGQFFGWVAEGLFNSWEEVNHVNRPVYMWNNNKIQPGDVKYKDINGDGIINDDDQVPIGYSNFPEKIFGLSFGGSYKGFDFSVLFQAATNVSTAPSRRSTRGFYSYSGASKDLLKSWSEERYTQELPIRYPRMSVTNNEHNYVVSTFWLEDASYIRLKNLEIGYTFRNEVLKRINLSSIRVYLNGNNLITWCDLFPGEDPEFPNGEANIEPYPVMRTYNLGFNINF